MPYSTLVDQHVYLRKAENKDLETRLPFKLSSENAQEMNEEEMKNILKIATKNSSTSFINKMEY